MFAISVRYLTGRVAAREVSAREVVEWPPHPDRLFQALVSTAHDGDPIAGADDALRWLEQLPPPAIAAADDSTLGLRAVLTHYVPVNDSFKAGKNTPSSRSRQGRTFASASLPDDDDTVVFQWRHVSAPPEHLPALRALAARMSRLGHSTSLVGASLHCDGTVPTARWEPSPGPSAALRLRVPGPGRLDILRATWGTEPETVKENTPERRRPVPGRWASYRRTAAVPAARPGSVFDADIYTLRLIGDRRLELPNALNLCAAARGAVMSAFPLQPVPEWVSGHDDAGAPTTAPHLAFVPLPFVGGDHGDGRVLGVGVLVPRDVERAQRALLDAGVREIDRLVLGAAGAFEVTAELATSAALTLQPGIWNATATGASSWASVTPFVFHRYPKAPGDAEALVRQACGFVGLPEPERVEVGVHSPWRGVPHARAFPPFGPHRGRPSRVHRHVALHFAEPVEGPIALGAGRFLGYGLMRPRQTSDSR